MSDPASEDDDKETGAPRAPFWERLASGLPTGFLRNVGWQYVSTVAALGIGFAYSVVVGTALGAERFGLIALNVGFVAVVFQFLELRLHEVVIKYFASYTEANDDAKRIALVKLSLVLDVASSALASL